MSYRTTTKVTGKGVSSSTAVPGVGGKLRGKKKGELGVGGGGASWGTGRTVGFKEDYYRGGDKDDDDDFAQTHRRPPVRRRHKSGGNNNGGRRSNHIHNHPGGGGGGDDRSVSELIIQSALMGLNTGGCGWERDDFGRKPDLWMVAFDNPMDFIQYCRKRMDHEKELLERSRRTETEIVKLIRRWTESAEKHAGVLEDLAKVQNHNDKLQEVIMEERTNCQHLVGENYQLETERKMLSRKYQAALLLGKVNDKSVKHLLERNPKAVPLTDKMADLDEKLKKCDLKFKGGGDACADPYVLAEKVEKLESYIKSLKKQHHEEVTTLKDAIANYDTKYDSLKLHYRDALQRNAHAFDEVREVLAVSINENLELREELLKRDDNFLQMQLDGIEKLTCKRPPQPRLTSGNEHNFVEEVDDLDYEERTDGKSEKKLQLKLSKMEIEVEEKSTLLQDVLNKLMVLERTCSRLKEENAALKASHQHSLNALRERNQVLQKRCEKTDERRKLDNVGFREDVRELRFLIKTLDKNVHKCIRVYGELETAEAQPPVAEDDFEAIIEDQKSVDRYKEWLKKTDSRLVQKAMTSWTDFLENKLNTLDQMIQSRKD